MKDVTLKKYINWHNPHFLLNNNNLKEVTNIKNGRNRIGKNNGSVFFFLPIYFPFFAMQTAAISSFKRGNKYEKHDIRKTS